MVKYHVQYQALEYANSILPVPENYPLRQGIDEDFRNDFKELTEFAKTMYLDIANNPDKYGMPLADVNEGKSDIGSLMGHGLVHLQSWLSLHKAADILYALSCSGKIEGDILKVDALVFSSKVKEMKLSGYSPILDGLSDMGFVFQGFIKGKVKGEFITVAFPINPIIIKALKTYCDCRNNVRIEKRSIKEIMDFHAFDYKFTADHSTLPEINWVRDRAFTWDTDAQKFYAAFYQFMTDKLKAEYNCDDPHADFYIHGQMAAKLRYEDDHFRCEIGSFTNPEYKEIMTKAKEIKKTFFVLILYLRIKDDNNKDRFDKLPAHIIEHMINQKCLDCNAFEKHKVKSGGRCPYTVIWEYDGTENKNCAFGCFHFENPQIEDIPAFCELLAVEYERPGFKNINRCHVRA